MSCEVEITETSVTVKHDGAELAELVAAAQMLYDATRPRDRGFSRGFGLQASERDSGLRTHTDKRYGGEIEPVRAEADDGAPH